MADVTVDSAEFAEDADLGTGACDTEADGALAELTTASGNEIAALLMEFVIIAID